MVSPWRGLRLRSLAHGTSKRAYLRQHDINTVQAFEITITGEERQVVCRGGGGDEGVRRVETCLAAPAPAGQEAPIMRRDTSVDGQHGEPPLGVGERRQSASALARARDQHSVMEPAKRDGRDRRFLRRFRIWTSSARESAITKEVSRSPRLT